MGDHPLKQFRENNGLKPADLARLLGVKPPTVSRWESGDRKVGRKYLSTVSEKTGIPVRELRPDLAELIGDAA